MFSGAVVDVLDKLIGQHGTHDDQLASAGVRVHALDTCTHEYQ
jgi:hypothetical protein